ATKLLAAAKTAYALAKQREGVQNPDPPGFYREQSGEDDLMLGAAALARVTGDARYANEARAIQLTARAGTPVGWNSLDAIALLETGRACPAGSAERTEIARRLDALAAPIAATARTPVGPGSAFGYALQWFGNGSLAESLGAAATCLAARRLHDAPSTNTAEC